MLSKSKGSFATTLWSQILQAQGNCRPESRRIESLEYLCNTYWTPVYAFIRRRCTSDEKALDLTQDYFAVFLEKNFLDQVRPEKGRFRTFLLTSVKHFLSNNKDYHNASRRKPKGIIFSLTVENASKSIAMLASSEQPAEIQYMREWARAVVELAMRRMQDDCERHRCVDYYRILAHAISFPDSSYDTMADEMSWPIEKVRKNLYRARKKFAEVLRQTIRESVESEADVDDEIRDLRKFFV